MCVVGGQRTLLWPCFQLESCLLDDKLNSCVFVCVCVSHLASLEVEGEEVLGVMFRERNTF